MGSMRESYTGFSTNFFADWLCIIVDAVTVPWGGGEFI